MSVFEIVMLLCFGAAWPFSIYTSWTSRRTSGKSFAFLAIVIVGYGAGILNKVFYQLDGVVWMYAFNALMVSVDAALWLRNRRLERHGVSAEDITAGTGL
ncbi:MAG: hypothetical protein NT080_10035 [Spirochaetes bacterium]|nr:hypothetical protein [Spirochaetota bacterium]